MDGTSSRYDVYRLNGICQTVYCLPNMQTNEPRLSLHLDKRATTCDLCYLHRNDDGGSELPRSSPSPQSRGRTRCQDLVPG